MLRVGLTGGIASGKSTVARLLARHGAVVVDADRLVHDLLAPDGAAFEAVVERFGRDILDDAGRIDRGRLGALAFGDDDARADLERIVHPLVALEGDRRLAAAAAADGAAVAVLDAALLVETGRWREFDRVIVVSCPRETQIERIIARDGLTRAEAERRVAAQAPIERKLEVADHVIDTGGALAETAAQVEAVWASLSAAAGPPTRGDAP